MKYCFSAYGHPNITASHKTTLQFTKDKDISKRADCIVGVKADFNLEGLLGFLKHGNVKIAITAGGITETITAKLNRHFSSDTDVVIRKTDFCSGRTFAVNADKSAGNLSRKLVEALKIANISIEIESIDCI